MSSISKGFISLINVLGFIVFQLSGDVGRNFGPLAQFILAIEKLILGSFHQDDARFASTAGIHCDRSSLFALCFTKVKTAFT